MTVQTTYKTTTKYMRKGDIYSAPRVQDMGKHLELWDSVKKHKKPPQGALKGVIKQKKFWGVGVWGKTKSRVSSADRRENLHTRGFKGGGVNQLRNRFTIH